MTWRSIRESDQRLRKTENRLREEWEKLFKFLLSFIWKVMITEYSSSLNIKVWTVLMIRVLLSLAKVHSTAPNHICIYSNNI